MTGATVAIEALAPDGRVFTGTAHLDGVLSLDFRNGYAPSQGDTFIFLTTTNGLTGTFDSVAISGNNIPTITNQGLETTVITKNNATVLLGGLIRESTGKKEGGIPILRHIPLIKYLASSKEDTKDRSELLIFIQPRIVNGEGDLPNNYQDTPGGSPLGEEARRFFNQEKSDPMGEQKAVKRTKIGSLIRKLFN